MRLVIARCSVDYVGRLSAHLPPATRLVMVKADGSVSIHADDRAYKPLNWMSPPCRIEEAPGVWRVVNKAGEELLITLDEIFHDSSLSASGRMACATCHDASRAFAGTDGLAVPMGGPALETPGLRNAPSLKYLAYNPPFTVDVKGVPRGGMDRPADAPSWPQLLVGRVDDGIDRQLRDVGVDGADFPAPPLRRGLVGWNRLAIDDILSSELSVGVEFAGEVDPVIAFSVTVA